jgi:arsenate reductase
VAQSGSARLLWEQEVGGSNPLAPTNILKIRAGVGSREAKPARENSSSGGPREREDRARMKKKVLFICTHNSNRSQMAEGFLRSLYGDRYDVSSAGTTPTQVSPDAIEVMKEVGIDISRHRSKSVEEYLDTDFDYVVTVCDSAKEACPFFSRAKMRLHRSFKNPWDFKGTREEILNQARQVRNEIRTWIEEAFGGEDEESIQAYALRPTIGRIRKDTQDRAGS